MNKLAIIIPAYKATFFREALASIASQTNQNFHLYIGNDNSPENLNEIVEEFKDKIDLTYVKFEQNLGGKDLVAQWERCIAFSKDEEWIWLFSDDDVMDPNCVEEFYKAVEKNEEPFLYHFNVDVINASGERIEGKRYFPAELSSTEFLYGKMSGRYRSYVVEYIFSRESYNNCGGFPKFDLAWNSDDAMWFQLAEHSQIITLPKAKVFWRASGLNLSRIKDNKAIAEKKLLADLSFLKWLNPKIKELDEEYKLKFKKQLIYWFFIRIQNSVQILDKSFLKNLKADFYHSLYSNWQTLCVRLKVKFITSGLFRITVRIKKSIFN